MGTLKNQMISNMVVRGYSNKTIKCYTNCVSVFSNYFHKSPLTIEKNEIEQFFHHLRQSLKSDSTIHIYYESLKYFYKMNNLMDKLPKIVFSRINNKIPLILSKEEIQNMLKQCKSLKYKTIFTIIYSAGLRISELVNLKLSDIDFSRRTIFIRNSKNKKDRYTILGTETMILLQKYLEYYKPINFIFHANDIYNPISTDCIQGHFKNLIKQCNLPKSIPVHTLRHCFATHLLEDGTSIFYIMNLLGHSNIQTTMVYLHMQSLEKLNIKSPIDNMNIDNIFSTSSLHLESA